MNYSLGTIEASEALIKDLYINLRKRVNAWSDITKQTSQARMGYIGQHLTSIVTGYPGGKSGARGYDLIISRNPLRYGEIKTCYRVDQLGVCKDCGNVVSSIEKDCSICNSINIQRHDDSKWLIGVKDEQDLKKVLQPDVYYFVLFEMEDISNSNNMNIIASIWEVDPKNIGFKYCMVDYFYNIKGSAPLNIWPHMLKFQLFNPKLIYRSIIKENDEIETQIFPTLNNSSITELSNFNFYSQASNFTLDAVKYCLNELNVTFEDSCSKKELLSLLENERSSKKLSNIYLTDLISRAIYLPRISDKLGMFED
ncbi:MAG: MamI family restriction endonuclease [Clostridiales bacterium]|nr:MamI family restriction endonuclease [Clostridiales bacterium]